MANRRLQQASSVDDHGKDKDASFRDDATEVTILLSGTKLMGLYGIYAKLKSSQCRPAHYRIHVCGDGEQEECCVLQLACIFFSIKYLYFALYLSVSLAG